mgnify:FL=1
MKIKVSDMTCNHCVQKVQTALQNSGIDAHIDLPTHTVELKEDALVELARHAISKAGYTPE